MQEIRTMKRSQATTGFCGNIWHNIWEMATRTNPVFGYPFESRFMLLHVLVSLFVHHRSVWRLIFLWLWYRLPAGIVPEACEAAEHLVQGRRISRT